MLVICSAMLHLRRLELSPELPDCTAKAKAFGLNHRQDRYPPPPFWVKRPYVTTHVSLKREGVGAEDHKARIPTLLADSAYIYCTDGSQDLIYGDQGNGSVSVTSPHHCCWCGGGPEPRGPGGRSGRRGFRGSQGPGVGLSGSGVPSSHRPSRSDLHLCQATILHVRDPNTNLCAEGSGMWPRGFAIWQQSRLSGA